MNIGGSCDKGWCLSFFGYFTPDLSPWGYRNTFFLVALCRLIVSGDKNTMVVLVPCHAWKWVPTAISSGAIIPKVPGCHLLLQMTSQWGSQKLPQGSLFHVLTANLADFDLHFPQMFLHQITRKINFWKYEPLLCIFASSVRWRMRTTMK